MLSLVFRVEMLDVVVEASSWRAVVREESMGATRYLLAP